MEGGSEVGDGRGSGCRMEGDVQSGGGVVKSSLSVYASRDVRVARMRLVPLPLLHTSVDG